MARRSQQTFAKRQREHKRAEKAAQKRARRAASNDAPAPLSEISDASVGDDGGAVREDDAPAPE